MDPSISGDFKSCYTLRGSVWVILFWGCGGQGEGGDEDMAAESAATLRDRKAGLEPASMLPLTSLTRKQNFD